MNKSFISDVLKLSGCCQSKSARTLENSSRNTDIALQHLAKQSAFFLYLGVSGKMKNKTTDEIANLVQTVRSTPYRIRERVLNYQKEPLKISINIASIVSNWLLDSLLKPKLFAKAIVQYFEENTENLTYFALIVFPSIYRHFIFDEFQNEAMKLISEVINLGKQEIAAPLVMSFSFLDGNFFKAFWGNYDSAVSVGVLPLSQSDSLSILIDSFTFAFNALTENQQKALIMLAEASKTMFAKIFFCEIATRSYIIAHNQVPIKESNDKVIQILNYIGMNPNSPHFNIFFNAMSHRTGYNIAMKQSNTFMCSSTTLILSFRDLYILQQVVLSSPGLSTHFNKNLLISSAFEWIVDALTIDLTLDFLQPSLEITDDFLPVAPLDIQFEETPEMKKKMKKVSILSKKHVLDVVDEKIVTRKIKRIRKKINYVDDSDFVSYALSSVVSSSCDELKNCEMLFNKISSQKMLERNVETWSDNLQKAIQYISPIVTGSDTPFESCQTLNTKSMASMKVAPMRSNAMKRFRDVSEMKLRKSSGSIGDNVASVNGKTTQNKKSEKKLIKTIPKKDSKTYSTQREKETAKEDNYTFSREEVAQICESYQSQDLKFWALLQKIDAWKPPFANFKDVRNQYNDYINVAKMHLKTQPIANKEIIPYLQRCARSFDSLALMKRGMSIVHLAKIANDIEAICDQFSSPTLSDVDIVYLTATLSINDGFFATFLISEEVFAEFSDIKEMMNSRYLSNFSFIERVAWKFIEFLSKDFAQKCREAIKKA